MVDVNADLRWLLAIKSAGIVEGVVCEQFLPRFKLH